MTTCYLYLLQTESDIALNIDHERLDYHFTCAIAISLKENACGYINIHYIHSGPTWSTGFCNLISYQR